MNLLECYIKEVHEVKEIKSQFRDGTFIVVDLTIDTYGSIRRTTASFNNMEEWNKVKEQGYYMG